ncbi:MAG: tRNA 2-thiouridine(34) synthase MnmA [Candidatus Paceibacterota bacterium]|jgi:tRNA-specific 2-thiouridylase
MENRKIICAISGGVDSAVSAALLKEAGFNVAGVFMKLVDSASFADSEKSAKKVAAKLGIPLRILDLRKEFKKKIIEPFLKHYLSGNTPNPCINCNQQIKFNLILDRISSDKDFLATGHYARIEKKGGDYMLLKGKDKNKDQSYFLWKLSQRELKRTIFPLAYFTKKETKRLAESFNLPVSGRKESQEICFVPGDIKNFLKRHLKLKEGRVINTEGKVLSRHQGLQLFTIGQRRGINLPGGPYYVLNKNIKDNILVVTKNEKDLYTKSFCVKEVNWISGKKQKSLKNVVIKIRYRDKGSPADVFLSGSRGRIIFKKPQRAITPGQSAVAYRGERLLMGGIIC